MEKLKLRLALAHKALNKLQELVHKENLSEIERDALIQRFEFSYEILWKCAKDYLRVEEGIEAASPRRVIRECQAMAVLTPEETKLALKMCDDRNLTTHTYDEEFAKELTAKIPEYATLLEKWLHKLAVS